MLQLSEGPATQLQIDTPRKLRISAFVPSFEPSYPAVMYYSPLTDEPFWVECDDPFTIHVALMKNKAAIEIAATMPAPKSLAELQSEWADRLYSAVRSYGIECKYVAPLADGAKFGHQVDIDGIRHPADAQLHVDWDGEIDDVTAPFDLLAAAIARNLKPHNDLYCAQLWCPSRGAEAVLLKREDFVARALRSIIATYDGTEIANVFAVTRIDVLFPVLK